MAQQFIDQETYWDDDESDNPSIPSKGNIYIFAYIHWQSVNKFCIISDQSNIFMLELIYV